MLPRHGDDGLRVNQLVGLEGGDLPAANKGGVDAAVRRRGHGLVGAGLQDEEEEQTGNRRADEQDRCPDRCPAQGLLEEQLLRG